MLNKIGSTGFACALALGFLFLGGCDDKLKAERNQLFQENQELRAKSDAQAKELENTQKAAAAAIEKSTTPLAAAPAGDTVIAKGSGSNAPVTLDEGYTVTSNSKNTTIRVTGDVLFAPGQATLKTEAKQSLSKLASMIKTKYAGKPINVIGYTDSDPIRHSKWKSNEELSNARADAVEKYLASVGVKNHMVALGKGAANPQPTKAQSRRVEVVVAK